MVPKSLYSIISKKKKSLYSIMYIFFKEYYVHITMVKIQ